MNAEREISDAMNLAPEIIRKNPLVFQPSRTFESDFPSKRFRCPKCGHTVYLWWSRDSKKWVVRPMGLCDCFGKKREWANDAAGLMQALIETREHRACPKSEGFSLLMRLSKSGEILNEEANRDYEELSDEKGRERFERAKRKREANSKRLLEELRRRGVEAKSLDEDIRRSVGWLYMGRSVSGVAYELERVRDGKIVSDGIEVRNTVGEPFPKALCYGKKGCFLLRSALKSDTLFIFEGPMDALSAASLGLEGVCATMGAASTKEIIRALSEFRRRAVIVFDADEAGQVGAKRLKEELLAVGLSASILRVSIGLQKDLNGLLMEDRRRAMDRVSVLRAISMLKDELSDDFIESLETRLKAGEDEAVLDELRGLWREKNGRV